MSEKNPAAYQTGDSPFDKMAQRQTAEVERLRAEVQTLRSNYVSSKARSWQQSRYRREATRTRAARFWNNPQRNGHHERTITI